MVRLAPLILISAPLLALPTLAQTWQNVATLAQTNSYNPPGSLPQTTTFDIQSPAIASQAPAETPSYYNNPIVTSVAVIPAGPASSSSSKGGSSSSSSTPSSTASILAQTTAASGRADAAMTSADARGALVSVAAAGAMALVGAVLVL